MTGFSPRFMTYQEQIISFTKKRWTEVVREIIRLCSITRDDFLQKISVLQQKDLHDVEAVFGKVDGYFIVPERNGWIYILEWDISIRISTANHMWEMVKQLVKGTDYEGEICLFLHHNYRENSYRTVPI